MSNAGTQLRSRNAALIPLAGVVLGAIDPAIVCCWRQVAQKKTQHRAPGSVHDKNQPCTRCLEIVETAYAGRLEKVKQEHRGRGVGSPLH